MADLIHHSPVALIASGSGRYADPWHPFSETSEAIAALLEADDWQVQVAPEPDSALTMLEGVDLLVVNAGDPWRSDAAAVGGNPASEMGLREALARGIGLLGLHCAVSTYRDYPQWREAIGGEWVPGHSWHPPIGDSLVKSADPGSAAPRLVPDAILVFDELYTNLVIDEGVQVHATHEIASTTHPVIWSKQTGPVRAVVSTLGHDSHAYESATYREVLLRASRWAATGTA